MARLAFKEVRVPTKRVRAEKILAALEGNGPCNEYIAAGAISPNDGVALIRAKSAGMALTLADGTVVGEIMKVKCTDVKVPGTDTAVLTPANLTGGATLTFDEVNEECTLIWVGAAWTPRPGYTCTLA